MTELNISRHILPTRYDSNNGLASIIDWLDEHVGPKNTDYSGIKERVMSAGVGWEIRTKRNGNFNESESTGYAIVTWHVLIKDEQKAMMFALKWT
jgi:hypothetical protein